MTKRKSSEVAQKVRELVVAIEPSAELLLYGSHCRGDCANGKDWDFLVLLDGPVDSARADRVRHPLYKLSMEIGEDINAVFKDKQDWNDVKHKNVPLYERIRREGIAL